MSAITEEQQLKRCSECGILKPLSEYNRSIGGKYGVQSLCKICSKEKGQNYIKRNKQKNLDKELNGIILPETDLKMCSVCKEYKPRSDFHKSMGTCDGKQYVCIKCKGERRKKKYRENPENELKKSREYRQTERGKFLHRNKEHRRRMQKNATPEEHKITESQWRKLIESQDYKCARCGCKFTDENKPTMDHIVPLSKGGEHTSANIQALCQTCNSSKGGNMNYDKIQTWIMENK